MLWQKVAPDAVNDAMQLVAKCPELKGMLQLPRDRPMPWEVTPLIGLVCSLILTACTPVHLICLTQYKFELSMPVELTKQSTGIPKVSQ